MAESLKKGIGTKYLLPIVAVYAAAAGLLGLDKVTLAQSALQHVGAAGVGGVVLLVLQDLIPRAAKEVIVFWRLRDRLPGCRAFSVIAKRDQRISSAELAAMLPSAAMSPGEQNALWYRWLKSVETDPAIADNHHRFLALRDCAVLLLLLSIATPLLALLPGQSPQGVVVLIAGCFVSYVITAIAAQNSAVRLVGNVIARKIATT